MGGEREERARERERERERERAKEKERESKREREQERERERERERAIEREAARPEAFRPPLHLPLSFLGSGASVRGVHGAGAALLACARLVSVGSC